MRPTIGALRHRVVLEDVSRTGDGGGGAIETWIPVAEVWAAIATMGGDERLEAEQLAGRLTHRVRCRFRGDVRPAMRFRHGTRLLEIVAITDQDERHRFLDCLCRETEL